MRRDNGWNLILFFVLAYALMWACFWTVALRGIPTNSLAGGALIYVGAFAPSLAAIALTSWTEGGVGVRALLARILRFDVGVRWYVFALAYVPAIKLTAAVIHRAAFGAWPRFGTEPLILIPFAIAISTPVQAGEEVGWRGYALPRLAERFGLPAASVVLGVLWGFWHLPQFFIREADTYGQSFTLYVIQVTALSVAVAWLYAKTQGSLALVMLLHAAANNSKDIVPSAVQGAGDSFALGASRIAWLSVTLLWIAAAYFLARMPRLELSKDES